MLYYSNILYYIIYYRTMSIILNIIWYHIMLHHIVFSYISYTIHITYSILCILSFVFCIKTTLEYIMHHMRYILFYKQIYDIVYCILYIVYSIACKYTYIMYIYIHIIAVFDIKTLVWSGHSAPSRAGWSRCPHRYRDSANSLAWQVGRFVSTSASAKNVGVWSLQMYWGFGWLKIFGHVEENTVFGFVERAIWWQRFGT